MPSQRRDGEGRALHFGGRELAGARLFGQRAKFPGKLNDAFLVDVLDDGDHEAVRRVHGDAYVPIAAHNQGVAAGAESGVESREGLQRRDRRTHEKRQQRHPVRL